MMAAIAAESKAAALKVADKDKAEVDNAEVDNAEADKMKTEVCLPVALVAGVVKALSHAWPSAAVPLSHANAAPSLPSLVRCQPASADCPFRHSAHH